MTLKPEVDIQPAGALRHQLVSMQNGRVYFASCLFRRLQVFVATVIHMTNEILDVFNRMLAVGRFDTSWSQTVFTMLPKGGNLFSPSPIAILKITHNIFAKLVYKRWRPTLEKHQSKHQVGFRPCASVEDAFVVLENVCSISLEWKFPVWFASVDLKKAVRVGHAYLQP